MRLILIAPKLQPKPVTDGPTDPVGQQRSCWYTCTAGAGVSAGDSNTVTGSNTNTVTGITSDSITVSDSNSYTVIITDTTSDNNTITVINNDNYSDITTTLNHVSWFLLKITRP